MLTPEDIKNALKAVKYPGYSRDIVSFGLIKEAAAANGAVSVLMQLTSANPEAARQIKEDSERILRTLPDVKHVHVEVRQPTSGQAPPRAAMAGYSIPFVLSSNSPALLPAKTRWLWQSTKPGITA